MNKSNLVIPMEPEELREYEIELESDWWLEPDVKDDMFRILHTVKDYTCKTEGSPIKKYLAVRWVLVWKTALLVDGVLLDIFSANVIYQVAQQLMRENNKKIFLKVFNKNIQTIAHICFKCMR